MNKCSGVWMTKLVKTYVKFKNINLIKIVQQN